MAGRQEAGHDEFGATSRRPGRHLCAPAMSAKSAHEHTPSQRLHTTVPKQDCGRKDPSAESVPEAESKRRAHLAQTASCWDVGNHADTEIRTNIMPGSFNAFGEDDGTCLGAWRNAGVSGQARRPRRAEFFVLLI